MTYQHGIRVTEQATGVIAGPVKSKASLQVVFGTAPVNLADDPYSATNTPVIAYDWAEAVAKLGYSADWKNYTICQSMYASFQLIGVAPVVFINVLDPKTHKKKNAKQTVKIEELEGTVKLPGILKDTVTVAVKGAEGAEDTPLGIDADYFMSFDEDGYLVITLTAKGAGAGAAEITVESTSIDPSMVTTADIIGSSAAGAEKGFEVLRQVYSKCELVPGLLLAPGWSHIPEVGVVLAAKCKEINGIFNCEGFVDIDSTKDGCVTYDKVKQAKEAAGYNSPRVMALWPCVSVGAAWLWYSAVMGAVTAHLDATNDDVPNLSPSNKPMDISGMVLADGETEVTLDLQQANAVNSAGVTTAINLSGWRTWGNRTAAYPAKSDQKESFFCWRRFFSWWGNSFILAYLQNVDDPANRRLIELIVDAENIRGASYVADGKCIRAEIEFIESENPITNLVDGKLKFHQYLTPYPLAEDIVNVLEFDPNALTLAFNN